MLGFSEGYSLKMLSMYVGAYTFQGLFDEVCPCCGISISKNLC